jgi:hypothetical protein
VLNDIRPQNILEFGIGQTTRLTSQYATFANPSAQLAVVEHDVIWLELFKKTLGLGQSSHPNIALHHLEITKTQMDAKSFWTYKDLEKNLNTGKYDLVIVDGKSSQSNSRAYVLTLIPEYLSDTYVIIIDDAQRVGEQQTSLAVRKKLADCGIPFSYGRYLGSKQQDVICSKSLSFLLTL